MNNVKVIKGPEILLTKKSFVDPSQRPCKIGSMIHSRFRNGDVCFRYRGIPNTELYFNKAVMKSAIINSKAFLEKELGIKIIDLNAEFKKMEQEVHPEEEITNEDVQTRSQEVTEEIEEKEKQEEVKGESKVNHGDESENVSDEKFSKEGESSKADTQEETKEEIEDYSPETFTPEPTDVVEGEPIVKLEDLTVKELYQQGKDMNLEVKSTMKKQELIDVIRRG